MAGSINKVTLLGNLGRDPEVRSLPAGGRVCTLSVATSRRWRDRDSGETQERTEWHRVVIFAQPLVEVAERYLAKGGKVYVEGELATRKWTDQSGQERYTTEVLLRPYRSELVLLGGPRAGGGYDRSGMPDAAAPAATGATAAAAAATPVVEDLPVIMPEDNVPLENELDDSVPF